MTLKIGATSFVYPAGWLENAQRLSGDVHDVELLFFAPTGPDGLPSAAEIERLRDLGQARGLSYTVHTPLCVQLASPDPEIRRAAVRDIARVVKLCEPLEPWANIVHVYRGAREHDPNPEGEWPQWRRWAHAGLSELVEAVGHTERLCVESLDYDLKELEDVVSALDLHWALDLGHHLREGRPLDGTVDRYLERTRVVQWHGVDPAARDHRGLRHVPQEQTRWLLRTLHERNYDGILTLEVFGLDDWRESLAIVQDIMRDEGIPWTEKLQLEKS